MSNQNDGGPAHPCLVPIPGALHACDEPPPMKRHYGMTLRDYFAAKAMASMLNLCVNDSREEGLGYPEHIAAVSYGMADAMLKERAK